MTKRKSGCQNNEAVTYYQTSYQHFSDARRQWQLFKLQREKNFNIELYTPAPKKQSNLKVKTCKTLLDAPILWLKNTTWNVILHQNITEIWQRGRNGTAENNWEVRGASLMAQMVKRLPTMWEIQVQFLGWEDLLEKETATPSSILAWKIPWMEEPDGLQSMRSQRVGHDWVTSLSFLFVFTVKVCFF